MYDQFIGFKLNNYHWKIGEIVAIQDHNNSGGEPFILVGKVLGQAAEGADTYKTNENKALIPTGNKTAGSVWLSIKKIYSDNYLDEEFAKEYLKNKDLYVCSVCSIQDTNLDFYELELEDLTDKQYVTFEEAWEKNEFRDKYFTSRDEEVNKKHKRSLFDLAPPVLYI